MTPHLIAAIGSTVVVVVLFRRAMRAATIEYPWIFDLWCMFTIYLWSQI